MSKKILLILSAGFGCERVFGDLFAKTVEYKHPSQISPDCVLLFEGGADISPQIYHDPVHEATGYIDHARDAKEVEAFEAAQRVGVPSIGICRGAQLQCALSGGKLFQHVSGHGSSHYLMTLDHDTLLTSSVHHQMMNPFVLPVTDYRLIAWSREPISKKYLHSTEGYKEPEVEPEIVFFEKTKSLAIQGHPEFMRQVTPFVQYCRKLTQEYILNV